MTYREKINKLTKEEWLEAVEKSTSLQTLYENIGIASNGSLRKAVGDRLNHYKIDTKHFGILQEKDPKYIEKIKECIKDSKSIAEVIRKLGGSITGSRYQEINRIIKNNDINVSHVTGSGWNIVKKPLSEILVEDYDISSSYLKKRLIKEKVLKDKCSRCNIDSWCGEKLSLQLDHVNGNNKDQRKENLRILCPNCHSLTSTFSGRNKK